MSRTPSMIGGALLTAALASSCGLQPTNDPETTTVQTAALTAAQRLTACTQDPRVVTGLATKEICAGAGLFFEETFGGNGRTCGTCHPAQNNLTIDTAFVATLPPTDPLFVFEQDPTNLGPDAQGGAGLETASLRAAAGILENVDDFQDPRHKFVIRSVPHVLSMATSIAADAADPDATIPPLERTGWGGDGAPGAGTLRDFLNGAIKQHYTKTLQRREGIDFRVASPQELDLVRLFQLALGRLNEPDLNQVNLADAQAQQGRLAYLDPMRGRCQVCHLNGGGNFQDTNKNRNFDTGTRLAPNGQFTIPFFNGVAIFDGGFGGQGLTQPNIVTNPFMGDATPNNGFGNNSFNTPPVIEAADTLPSFHSNAFGAPNNFGGPPTDNIENVVTFYAGLFQGSRSAVVLDQRFGGVANVGPSIADIGRFLRALNVALNVDMAKQRLRASQTILNRFRDQHLAIQKGLITLAVAEIDDALQVLTDPVTPQPFYPSAVDRLNLAKTEIAAALAGATWGQRQGPLSNAISRTENARDQLGANITFTLGAGNLFF